jgi:hypothetical protein
MVVTSEIVIIHSAVGMHNAFNSREGVRINLERRSGEEEVEMAMIVDLFRRLEGEG